MSRSALSLATSRRSLPTLHGNLVKLDPLLKEQIEAKNIVPSHQNMGLDYPKMDWSAEPRKKHIISLVERGEILPADAERLCAEAGLGSLVNQPVGEMFDVALEPYWTPAMTVAWILWRKPENVQQYYKTYSDNVRLWREIEPGKFKYKDGTEHKDFLFLYLEVPLAMGEKLTRDIPKDVASSDSLLGMALNEFIRTLIQGKVIGFGIPEGKKRTVEIDPLEWRNLYFDYNGTSALFKSSDQIAYKNIGFPTNDVTDFWPFFVVDEGDMSSAPDLSEKNESNFDFTAKSFRDEHAVDVEQGSGDELSGGVQEDDPLHSGEGADGGKNYLGKMQRLIYDYIRRNHNGRWLTFGDVPNRNDAIQKIIDGMSDVPPIKKTFHRRTYERYCEDINQVYPGAIPDVLSKN